MWAHTTYIVHNVSIHRLTLCLPESNTLIYTICTTCPTISCLTASYSITYSLITSCFYRMASAMKKLGSCLATGHPVLSGPLGCSTCGTRRSEKGRPLLSNHLVLSHLYRLFIIIHLQIVFSTFRFSYQYVECVDCLRKSTNINFLQEGVWFSMGYAANQIADYNTAVESFRNCVTLEPDVCAVPHLVCVLQLDCKLLSSKYCCLLVYVEWRSLE